MSGLPNVQHPLDALKFALKGEPEALRLKRCDGKIAERKAAVEREISELRARTVKNRNLLAGLYESFVGFALPRARPDSLSLCEQLPADNRLMGIS